MREQVLLEALIAKASASPLALARLARTMFGSGKKIRAREIGVSALEAAPDNAEVRSLAHSVLSRGVAPWYFSIVRDEARNAAFEGAIRRAVSATTKVLEIGAGSAMFAMMAARAGAKQVVTCEMHSGVADAARDIVALNGYADRVRVLAKASLEIDPDADLGGRADLLIAEIMTSSIVTNDALPTIEHAVRALGKPGVQVIPARAVIRVALACDSGFELERMGAHRGFDLSPFNRLTKNSYLVEPGAARISLLSAPADLLDFDFQSGGPFPAATSSRQLVSTGGRANGIVHWIALQLDDEAWFGNDPREDTRWAARFWPFAAPRDCPAGIDVTVTGAHDRGELRIWA